MKIVPPEKIILAQYLLIRNKIVMNRKEPVDYFVFILQFTTIFILLVLNIFIWAWPVLPGSLRTLYPIRAIDIYFTFMCHRLPSRSFWFHGAPIALCHRCSGIYLGMLIGFFLGFFSRPSDFRRIFWSVIGLGILMGIEWFGEIFGVWNILWLRFFSGLGFGVAIGLFLHTGLRVIAEESRRPSSS